MINAFLHQYGRLVDFDMTIKNEVAAASPAVLMDKVRWKVGEYFKQEVLKLNSKLYKNTGFAFVRHVAERKL